MPPDRLHTRCLLRPEDFSASQDDMHVVGVFNPGVATTPQGTVLLVRVAEVPRPRAGWIGLPRWDVRAQRIECDWVHEADVVRDDHRHVRFPRDGVVRPTTVSHLGIVRLSRSGDVDRIESRRFLPTDPLEEYGVEDPRITQIGDFHYLAYNAVSRYGSAAALASTRDFRAFHRHGVIFCPENRNVVLWPEKVAGRFLALHGPTLAKPLARPSIWTATSENLMRWGEFRPLHASTSGWEHAGLGAGTPPIRTSVGWLSFYHGRDAVGDLAATCRGGLLLHDRNEPSRILSVAGPVFVPEEDFERIGSVPDVVFPTGAVVEDDLITVYYGAADAATGVTQFRREDLIAFVHSGEPALKAI